MSDNWLRIVPTDPTHTPSKESVEEALSLLWKILPQSDEIEATSIEHPQFIDAGSNWSGVNCPECGTSLDDWWSEEMDCAYGKRFSDLSCHLPCCGAKSNLNKLDYPWQVAFASFVLEAMNPGTAEFSQTSIKQIEAALKTPVKLVWQHI